MSTIPVPEIRIPSTDELEIRLSANVSIEERVRYVKGLLVDAQRVSNGLENFQREIRRLEESKASMASELTGLRQKLSGIEPGGKNAVEQRYDMLGKMQRARNQLDRFEADTIAACKAMRETLKK